jgi:hypothetical protein
MHLQSTLRYTHPTREIAERIRSFGEGGEELFVRANLRPQDEVWWTEAVRNIVKLMIEGCEAREASDATLAARIPEDAYRTCYSDRDKEKVTQDHIRSMRNGRAWVLIIGYLIRDTERLLLEAIHMGDSVIKARSLLRAFAWVIACETGMYKVLPEEGHPDDSLSEFPSEADAEEHGIR